MPPLEAKKILFNMAAKRMKSGHLTRRKMRMKLMFVDVKKAHLNGVCEEEIYVELPAESMASGKCGKLRRWLYGMRGASQAWEKDYTARLEKEGFQRGLASAAVFVNKDLELYLVVHGDDFTFLGYESELLKMKAKMEDWYQIKCRGFIGDDQGDCKEMSILNRLVAWDGRQLIYTADKKHRNIVMEDLGLQPGHSKALSMPISRESLEEMQMDGEELSSQEATEFRRLVARLNFLGQDRPDIQFSVKELSRKMSSPTMGAWRAVKRLGRYLMKVMEVQIVFDSEGLESEIMAYSDSDWGGCVSSRKSTSGGIITWAGKAMKSWSRTQSTIALSSAEAEYYAAASTAAEALGFQSVLRDLGVEAKVTVLTDSSAAKSMACRVGIGRTRHVDVKYLWLQQLVKERLLDLRKVKGTENPADIFTKPKGLDDLISLCGRCGCKLVLHGSM
jgi:hypothetical protein